MGLLKLLTFPVSGPVAGVKWTLNTLLSEAERRYYDPATIQHEMAELQHRFDAGLIDQKSFDEREEALLARLLDAREYQRRQVEPGE